VVIPLFKVFMSEDAPRRVADTLMSGYIGQGERCEEFEAAFGELVGAPEPPLLLNSCTSAIDLALHLCGVGPGDEVISTPVTCTATNSPIVTRGARIVWADVDPLTGCVDPADVARKVTDRTKVVIAVDWAGRACEYGTLHRATMTTERPIPVIEDAAHALLARYDGVSIARIGGDYVTYSLQAIKHLTTGDGGVLITPEWETERARLLRWYGLDRRSGADFRCAQDIREVGYKYQSNDIAASIGLANLPHAEGLVAAHRANAAYYDRALVNLPGITLPPPDPGCSYWLYSMLVEDRDAFMAHMAERGVATSRVHRRNDSHPAFHFPSGPLPGVDYFDAHHVAIPVGWWLSERDRERITALVIGWSGLLHRAGHVGQRAPVGAR
jgi:dTDP-4-amino-4,6-dideoxygalactose transaminase